MLGEQVHSNKKAHANVLLVAKVKNSSRKRGTCSSRSACRTSRLHRTTDPALRWGFLVIFWNFAGVPFVSHPPCHLVLRLFLTLRQSYIYSVVYMASHDPSKYRFSTLGYVALYTTLLTAYYVYALSIFP